MKFTNSIWQKFYNSEIPEKELDEFERNKNFSHLNNDENNFNDENKNNKFNNTNYLFNSPEQTVFENLYSRRFDSQIKKEKITKEIACDFKPKINNDYKGASNSSTNYYDDSMKKTKTNNIPLPKKQFNNSISINFNDPNYNNQNNNNNNCEESKINFISEKKI